MHLLAACSGGPDSTAMVFTLARLASELCFSLSVASVNHGLRESAKEEVAIAGRQATMLGLQFFPLHITFPHSISLQENARTARYKALKHLANQIGAHRIATGHTQDDQAETVIMRLLRGSGLGGLAGIQPSRKDRVIRPLIDCRRDEVHRFAYQNCSEIVNDPSNEDLRFERVRVRNNILPILEMEDRSIVQHLCDIADDARDQLHSISVAAQDLLDRASIKPEKLSRPILVTSDRAVRRNAIRLWIKRRIGEEPGRAHIVQLDKALKDYGEVWLPHGWTVSIVEESITCTQRKEQNGYKNNR